jgi:2-phosphoxylose phosphatase
MFSELAQNFIDFRAGTEPHKLRFYVGHDGSMIRLASGLGIGKDSLLRWPALGSEFVMEVRYVSYDNNWQLNIAASTGMEN